MGLKIVPTSVLPISLDEAKAYLRIDGNDDNAVVASLIEAATEWVEDQTGQQIRPASVVYSLDAFPLGREIKLPKPPLRSVDTVWYLNAAGNQQVFPFGTYAEDTVSRPGRVILKPGNSWPTTDGSPGCVWVEYDAGYANPAAVPSSLKQAIRFMVGHWFENREAAIDRRIDAVPLTVESILQQHSFPELA